MGEVLGMGLRADFFCALDWATKFGSEVRIHEEVKPLLPQVADPQLVHS